MTHLLYSNKFSGTIVNDSHYNDIPSGGKDVASQVQKLNHQFHHLFLHWWMSLNMTGWLQSRDVSLLLQSSLQELRGVYEGHSGGGRGCSFTFTPHNLNVQHPKNISVLIMAESILKGQLSHDSLTQVSEEWSVQLYQIFTWCFSNALVWFTWIFH